MEQNNQPVIDKLTPVGFRVLVNIYKKSDKTSSGFLLPENENGGMPTLAQIAVLGRKTWVQYLQLLFGMKPKYKIGQWVYFRKYSIDEMKVSTPDGDVTVYVLEEPEIIGLVNN